MSITRFTRISFVAFISIVIISVQNSESTSLAQFSSNYKVKPRVQFDEEPEDNEDENIYGNFTATHYEVELQVATKILNWFSTNDFKETLRREENEEEVEGVSAKMTVYGRSEIQQKHLVVRTYFTGINNNSVQVFRRGVTNGSIKVLRTEAAGQTTGEQQMIFHLEEELQPGDEIEIRMEYSALIFDCSFAWILPVTVCPYQYQTDSNETRMYYMSPPHNDVRVIPGFGEVRIQQLITDLMKSKTLVNCPKILFCNFFPWHKMPSLNMTIVRKEMYNVIFNSDLISSTPDTENPGWVKDKFANIRDMPYNKISFLVSDFANVTTSIENKMTRVYLPPHLLRKQLDTVTTLANKAARILKAYDAYFGDLNRIPKMDIIINHKVSGFEWMSKNMIVLSPSRPFKSFKFPYIQARPEFASNMETLKIVSFLGGLSLSDDWSINDNLEKQDLAINRFLQYVGLKADNSDIPGTEFMILQDLHDSYNSSDRDLVLLRMAEGILGEKGMQQGLRSYSRKLLSGAVQENHDEIFKSLQEVVEQLNVQLPEGLTMQKFRANWINRTGYPVVIVERVNNTHVKLSQQRHVKKDEFSQEEKEKWYILATYITSEQPEIQKVWLESNGVSKIIPVNASDWLLVNPDARGLFRTLYDESLLQRIQIQLETDPFVFGGIARSQLINDYVTFAQQAEHDPHTLLNLTRYFARETHYGVWESLLSGFTLSSKFKSHPEVLLLRNYLQTRIDSVLTATASNATGVTSLLKEDLFQLTCKLRGSRCTEYARKGLVFVEKGRGNLEELFGENDDDRKERFRCAVASGGGRKAFDLFYSKYQAYSSSFYQTRKFKILGLDCTSEPDLIKELLHKVLNHSAELKIYKEPERPFLDLASRSASQAEMMIFLSSNLEEVITSVGKGNASSVALIVDRLANHFSTKEQLNTVKTFIESNTNTLNPIATDLNASLRKIEKNIEWMDGTGRKILEWFSQNSN